MLSIKLRNVGKEKMPEKKVKDYWDEDWRDWKNGWPYTGDINNKKYLADRDKLFKEGGNGWWYFAGYQIRNKK